MSTHSDKLAELEHAYGTHRAFLIHLREIEHRRVRASFAGKDGLLNFIRHFWHVLEPNRPFAEGWALRAMCDHLQAVSNGDITRLLINVPPGSMKSLLVNVFWPAWEWGPFKRPDLRYVSFSYGSYLTERDNQRFLDLCESSQFRELYPKIELRDKGKVKVSNKSTGWKFATSVGGIGTGERGDRVMLDDPHNVKESESDTVRTGTVTWFKEAMSNRLNDMDESVIIVIMQRVHEDDVSGAILADELGYTHLCIPMEFEPDRRCITHTKEGRPFWRDPRRLEGECFWPERFSPAAVVTCKLLGEHMFAGQYQQRPEPRGGGLFKRDYWRRWPLERDRFFPKFHYVLVSIDGAFTDKEQNDPNGCTVWGAFTDAEGNAAVLTLAAWRKNLKLHGKVRKRRKGKTGEKPESWAAYRHETEADWGLIQWLEYECERWKADKLLIENKANGHDVANEMIRLFAWGKFIVELVDPGRNDKFSRGVRVQPCFSEGLVYTLEEKHGKKWVSGLITEAAMFPRGRFDDQVDSMTQALWWMRKAGFLVMAEERKQRLIQQETFKRRLTALYPV